MFLTLDKSLIPKTLDSRKHKKAHQNIKTKQKRQKRDFDPEKEYDKGKSPLDEAERRNYEERNEKIAYAMTIPRIDSGENVKVKVMDNIEGK